MSITVIDNYDSFTYNLVHLVSEVTGSRPAVMRNDQLDWNVLESSDALLFSPGPGLPEDAGELEKVIEKFSGTKKMLGVCLGHQAIGEVFGSKLKNLPKVYHGKQTKIKILQDHLMFSKIQNNLQVGRYHSWVVDKENLSPMLEVLATDDEGEIMAMCHKEYDIWGVQFHPESVMTPDGKQLIMNWLNNK